MGPLPAPLQENKTLSWRVFVREKLELKTFEDLETKSKGKKTKEGVDVETGEIANTYFSVNYRKRKKDGTWEDIKLKGNTTKASLQNILNDKDENWFNTINKKGTDNHTKEKKEEYNYKIHEYTVSNLQLLWEIIYDITILDEAKVRNKILENFSPNTFTAEQLTALSKIKFDDKGMGNLSAKAIRNILPMMSNGVNFTLRATAKINSLIELNKSEEEKTKDNDEKLEGLKSFITDKKARLRLSQFVDSFLSYHFEFFSQHMHRRKLIKESVVSQQHIWFV
jgi:hypothetical protein